jgi:hypothetical protein
LPTVIDPGTLRLICSDCGYIRNDEIISDKDAGRHRSEMLRSFLDEGSKDPGVAEYFASEFHCLSRIRLDKRASIQVAFPG